MPKYTSYKTYIPLKMIRSYKELKKDSSPFAVAFVDAIDKAMGDTEKLENGSLRVSCVKMVYINKSHTREGAALKLYVSDSTVRRYLADFVEMVSKYAGFIKWPNREIKAVKMANINTYEVDGQLTWGGKEENV